MIAGTMTAVVHPEDEPYVAECPEVGTVSQGKTIEEAVVLRHVILLTGGVRTDFIRSDCARTPKVKGMTVGCRADGK